MFLFVLVLKILCFKNFYVYTTQYFLWAHEYNQLTSCTKGVLYHLFRCYNFDASKDSYLGFKGLYIVEKAYLDIFQEKIL